MKATIASTELTRRHFLQRSLVSAAVLSAPGILVDLRGQGSPNNKLNLAGIGVGGQGGNDVDDLKAENIVALCDVDHAHAAHTFKKYPKAKVFADYRTMFDEMKEIDGVIIGTPDHHHAFASCVAFKHGKHVYCEKPLTHSVWEARQVAQAARAAKVATQMGNQGQASEGTRRLCEIVWADVIGPVRQVHVWTDRPSNGLFNEYWPQGVKRPTDTPPVPSTLNWDLWLGAAPERPYNPAYLPFKWRGWWDFGTGALGDIGCHRMDPLFRALKLGAPVSVQASSTRVNKETFPVGSMVTYQYPARDAVPQANNTHVKSLSGREAGGVVMPALELMWYDGGLRPPRPEGLPDGEQMGDNGWLLVGEKGFILNTKAFPESCEKAAAAVPKTIPRSPGHHLEWANACKGGPAAGSNFDWAGPLAEAVLLGNVALRLQLREDLTLSKLLWDAPSLKFTNLNEANQFVRREYRAGWQLEI